MYAITAPIDAVAKCVLAGIALHADQHSLIATVSLKTLAQYATVNERTVRRRIPEMEERNLIAVYHRRNGNVYVLLMPDLPAKVLSDIKVSVNERHKRQSLTDIRNSLSDIFGPLTDICMSKEQGSREQGVKEQGREGGYAPTTAPLSLDDFAITKAMEAWAAENGITVDLKTTTDKFLDYCRANGKHPVDVVAAWQLWVRRERPNNNTRQGNGKPRTPDDWQAWGKSIGDNGKPGESMQAYVRRLQSQWQPS